MLYLSTFSSFAVHDMRFLEVNHVPLEHPGNFKNVDSYPEHSYTYCYKLPMQADGYERRECGKCFKYKF